MAAIGEGGDQAREHHGGCVCRAGAKQLSRPRDALNGIAYEDDRQIVDARVRVHKVPAREERTEVEILEAKEAAG